MIIITARLFQQFSAEVWNKDEVHSVCKTSEGFHSKEVGLPNQVIVQRKQFLIETLEQPPPD